MTKPDNPVATPAPSLRLLAGLFLLSSAGLAFEINLTRLFSVSQFYHFAFMIVSIALLGYGASGTFLAIFPGWVKRQPERSLSLLALAASLSMLGSYLLINYLPFDSFSIAWDISQLGILTVHYIALALPFFFSGMSVGLLLSMYPHWSNLTYATNLLGSALGCLAALFAPSALGGEGTALLSSGISALAALLVVLDGHSIRTVTETSAAGSRRLTRRFWLPIASALLLFVTLTALVTRASGLLKIRWLDLHLSPYKSLSYALQASGAQLIYQRWNSFSRIDLVRSPGLHSYPGLSYRYMEPLPNQDGLTVDGDDISPVVDPDQDLDFTSYLPAAVAFQLKLGARTLILEPRGGLDIQMAFEQGSSHVTAVEMNPLIVSAAGDIYQDGRIQLETISGRSYLRQSDEHFDIIVLSLVNSYHPVRSGAYSLGEDYRYTVEAFRDALFHLEPGGMLVVMRWLQTPPSESLRVFALAVTALEEMSADPGAQLVVLRGYNAATIIAKKGPYTAAEIQRIREFAEQRSFDLIYAPGIRPEDANRFSILPEPVYYQAFSALLQAQPRTAFYASYPFDVTPPTDDHPFFGHFFKANQAGEILRDLGKTWQPFGGAGYFVIIALLVLVILIATILMILPAAISGRTRAAAQPKLVHLVYFGLIGFAFMLVEIPLIQQFILYLDQPAYAMTAILFSLLLFSALGSRYSTHASLDLSTGLLVVLLFALPWLLPLIFEHTLGFSLIIRVALTVLEIAPLGFLMGIPFPGGIRWMLADRDQPMDIPWVWAVNGATSVVSSVFAALMALSFGFHVVLALGALCYGGAWAALKARDQKDPAAILRR